MSSKKKGFSHNATCDLADNETNRNQHVLMSDFKNENNRKDDESIYSSSSSILTESSISSKIPNAVKSSMKFFTKKNKNKKSSQSHYDLSTTSNNLSFSTKLKRSTINFGLFMNNSKKKQNNTVLPNSVSSSTLFGYKNKNDSLVKIKRKSSMISITSKLFNNKKENHSNHHHSNNNSNIPNTSSLSIDMRSSVKYQSQQDILSSSSSSSSTTTTTTATSSSSSIVSSLIHSIDNNNNNNNNNNHSNLIIEESNNLSDSKSERIVLKNKQDIELSNRKRSKSQQDIKSNSNKSSMLEHLASKGSINHHPKSSTFIPSDRNNIPSNLSNDIPLFKGLITSTLTPLHTRLMNECDRILSLFILSPSDHIPSTNDIRNQLLSITEGVHKMSNLVDWKSDQFMKQKITENLFELEDDFKSQEITINSLKEIVNVLKQLMNQCLSQYYKIVEKVIVIPSKGYRIEGVNKIGDLTNPFMVQRENTFDYSNCKIDHRDDTAHWFRTYFLNQPIMTFFGYTPEDDPILMTFKIEHEPELAYRFICRSKSNTVAQFVLSSSLGDTSKYMAEDNSLWKSVIQNALPTLNFKRLAKMNQDQLISTGLQDEILTLDETSLHSKYKFGVLLIKEGQTTEEEWFSNTHDSKPFERFLNIIGKKIELNDYKGWAAGLDTKGGDSGEYTYVNEWNQNLIAYHISTLIPSKPGDKQQIQKKRHIGNDIVCIVFVEGNQPFSPSAIKSQFLHVFIVVHEEIWGENKVGWRVEIVTVEDVPTFGPSLPEDMAVFFSEKELESYILAKLINAEYAAFKSPKFAKPMDRAKENIVSNLVAKGYKLTQNNSSESNERSQFKKKHVKSPSYPFTPNISKSGNMIRELSGNIVGLARRKSELELNEKRSSRNSIYLSSNQLKKATKSNGSKKFLDVTKRSQSVQDLLTLASDDRRTDSKMGFKNRAQNILTSFPGFGHHSTVSLNDTYRRSSVTSQ